MTSNEILGAYEFVFCRRPRPRAEYRIEIRGFHGAAGADALVWQAYRKNEHGVWMRIPCATGREEKRFPRIVAKEGQRLLEQVRATNPDLSKLTYGGRQWMSTLSARLDLPQATTQQRGN